LKIKIGILIQIFELQNLDLIFSFTSGRYFDQISNNEVTTYYNVLDLLQEMGITDANIKWPNDIYIHDNKVAGILIQNNIAGTQIASTIIGIGLNVNQITFDPALPNPTSLQNELGKVLDLESILAQLCTTLEKRYLQSKSKRGMEDMLSDYTGLMYRFDEVAQYLIDNISQPGIIKGIDEQGKLLLQMGASIRAFEFQGLRFVI